MTLLPFFQGADACDALQKICSNNVNVSIGQVVYTGMLNRKGGYQTDCTVTRMDEQRYNYIVLYFGGAQLS